MNKHHLEELAMKISRIDHKFDLLQQKGSNNESLVDKKRELLKEYFQLKQQLNDKKR